MTTHNKYPIQQGQLDNFCGIYSLINAFVYLYDKRLKRRPLKMALISAFTEEWPVEELIQYGMDDIQMDHVIDRVVKRGYYGANFPISVTKPFARRRKWESRQMLREMEAFLASQTVAGTRLILIGTIEHWSLIKRMDATYVHFFDSAGFQRAFRRSFSLREGATRYLLIPSCIYFLTRMEEI